MTARIVSFPYVARQDAKVLILGSMPGAASLQASEYYAHPRNAFWPIMAGILRIDVRAPYSDRLAALQAGGIALWDVLASCVRKNSLDSDIESDSVIANDFGTFFATHPGIAQVCFNGGPAERYFKRLVPDLLTRTDLHYTRLPSTSPAHAALPFARKAEAWRSALIQP
jgi:TDG/mug DNA glycosylase family protein